MNISSETIARQVLEFKPLLESAFVNSVQTISDTALKFKFHTKEGSKNVVVTSNAFFVSRYSIPVTLANSGFSQFLKKKLYNQKAISFRQHESDRIVEWEFHDYFMVWEFFAGGNIVLCDKQWNILSSWLRRESQERTVKKGVPYQFPPSVGKPLDLESIAAFHSVNESLDDDFSKQFAQSETKLEPTKLDKTRSKLEHSLKAQLDSLEKFSSQVKEAQNKAFWIQSHQLELHQLLEALHRAQSKELSEQQINETLSHAARAGILGGSCRLRYLSKEKKLIVELD